MQRDRVRGGGLDRSPINESSSWSASRRATACRREREPRILAPARPRDSTPPWYGLAIRRRGRTLTWSLSLSTSPTPATKARPRRDARDFPWLDERRRLGPRVAGAGRQRVELGVFVHHSETQLVFLRARGARPREQRRRHRAEHSAACAAAADGIDGAVAERFAAAGFVLAECLLGDTRRGPRAAAPSRIARRRIQHGRRRHRRNQRPAAAATREQRLLPRPQQRRRSAQLVQIAPPRGRRRGLLHPAARVWHDPSSTPASPKSAYPNSLCKG